MEKTTKKPVIKTATNAKAVPAAKTATAAKTPAAKPAAKKPVAKATPAVKTAVAAKAASAVKTYALTIAVETPSAYKSSECYISGSIKELGAWDISKAVKADIKNGKAVLNLKLAAGVHVEFKVTAEKSWASVQKGCNYEELQNFSVKMDSDKTCEIKVCHFCGII